MPVPVTCTCSTPGAGTSGHNGYECSDPTKNAYCAAKQECYSTKTWMYGKFSDACRIPTSTAETMAESLALSSEDTFEHIGLIHIFALIGLCSSIYYGYHGIKNS